MHKDKPYNQCEYKFLKFDNALNLENGCFSGYASLFDQIDLGKDVVEKGAFQRSLDNRGTKNIRMLFQHNPDEPIGTWLQLAENSQGLFAKGALNLEVTKGKEVYALMQSGAIDGLSIGYQIVRAYKDKKSGIRHILEADLWEISIVTFPMLPQARVDQVSAAKNTSNRKSINSDAGQSALEQMIQATLLTKFKSAKNIFQT